MLRHLDVQGFDGAPCVVGDGFDAQHRELLSYVDGEIIHPAPWSDEAVARLGDLLRRLHEALASFEPPRDAQWQSWFGRAIGTPNGFGHCDVAPWNIVLRDGLPAVLIDWEVAGPVDHLTEIAMAAWHSAQLYDDDIAAMNSLSNAASRFRQVRLFVEAYGLAAPERHKFAERMIDFAAQSAANEVVEQAISPSTVRAPGVWGIAWRTRAVAWMLRHRVPLEACLA